MNKYIKPEFMLTSLTSSGLTGGNCAIQKADKELILDVLGDDFAQAFEDSASCEVVIEMLSYCKFTSIELGIAQAFFS